MAVLNMRGCGCPAHAVRIDRATRHGNPYVMGRDGDRADVIRKHACHIARNADYLRSLDDLRGRDLACWCAPAACHGDTLAYLAGIGFEQRLAWAQSVLAGGPVLPMQGGPRRGRTVAINRA